MASTNSRGNNIASPIDTTFKIVKDKAKNKKQEIIGKSLKEIREEERLRKERNKDKKLNNTAKKLSRKNGRK